MLKIGQVLKEHNIITSNNFLNIEELSGFIRQHFTHLSKNPQYFISVKILENIQENILSSVYNDYFDEYSSVKPLIQSILGEFAEIMRSNYNFLDLLSNYKDTYRKRLIIGIAMQNPILTKVTNKGDLSQLLFGDREQIHEFLVDQSGYNPDGKPDVFKIWRIILTANQWSINTFENLFIDISEQELKILKEGVKDIADSWIFNAKDYSFISQKAYTLFTKEGFRLQYELAQSLWLVAATMRNQQNLPLKLRKKYGFNKILGISWDLGLQVSSNKRFRKFSERSLRKIALNIEKLIQREPIVSTNLLFGESESTITSKERLDIYRTAITNIFNYMKDQGMSIFNTLKPKPFHKKYWGKEYTMAYHVIMGLGKHLGFDPLFFTEIDDLSFMEGASRAIEFIRHHFRNTPELRLSLFIFDQILTDRSRHGAWGSLNEAQALAVQRNYEYLISLNEEIDKSVIEREFNNPRFLSDSINKWFYDNVVVDRWYSESNFESYLLPKFNERREYMKTHTVIEFMQYQDQFKNAYDRFYTNVIKNHGFKLYGLLEMLHGVSEETHIEATLFNLMALNVDFGELYNELLWKEGYSIKH